MQIVDRMLHVCLYTFDFIAYIYIYMYLYIYMHFIVYIYIYHILCITCFLHFGVSYILHGRRNPGALAGRSKPQRQAGIRGVPVLDGTADEAACWTRAPGKEEEGWGHGGGKSHCACIQSFGHTLDPLQESGLVWARVGALARRRTRQ